VAAETTGDGPPPGAVDPLQEDTEGGLLLAEGRHQGAPPLGGDELAPDLLQGPVVPSEGDVVPLVLQNLRADQGHQANNMSVFFFRRCGHQKRKCFGVFSPPLM